MSRLTWDGTTEPVSRDQILRRERRQGFFFFTCSADHEQDWQPYPVDPYSCYMCDHTFMKMEDGSTAGINSLLLLGHPSRPHKGGQVVYRSDTIVVLVHGCCYGGHGGSSCGYLVLLGHISSSKAGFVQCFERCQQFRRSVFFLWPPTERTSFP